MIPDERKKVLEDLVFKATVAGDKYYFDMSEEKFSEQIKQDDECIIYKEFSKQREFGFENYANKIKEEIKGIVSSEELHFMAESHNYDDGTFLLEQIVDNPYCAIETAQMIYWLSAPDYYYDEFGGPENYNAECNKAFADFLVKMNQLAETRGFIIDTGVCLSQEMEGFIKDSQLDYSNDNYAKIPECFRL